MKDFEPKTGRLTPEEVVKLGALRMDPKNQELVTSLRNFARAAGLRQPSNVESFIQETLIDVFELGSSVLISV